MLHKWCWNLRESAFNLGDIVPVVQGVCQDFPTWVRKVISRIRNIVVDGIILPQTMQYECVPVETPVAKNGSLSIANMGGMYSCTSKAMAF